ncbi:MAG: hypothetical protein H6738_23270 [Alphaproteobacteria bacterium]|nr:hypothetical protein [Alphaproteobacteria bacterium]MCB9699726.1 hypothetical protein [Alphaproteobacteria bacterium]
MTPEVRYEAALGHAPPVWWRPVLGLFGRPVIALTLDPLTAYQVALEPSVYAGLRGFQPVRDDVLHELGQRQPHLLPVLHLRRTRGFVFHAAFVCWDPARHETWTLTDVAATPARQEGDVAAVLAARLRRASELYLEDERRNRRGELGDPDDYSLAWDAAAEHLEATGR